MTLSEPARTTAAPHRAVTGERRHPPLDRPTETGVYKEKHRQERKETDLYAEERLEYMVERARRDGRVDVAALVEELSVTAETIRRDLTALERQGLLRRVHGGAIPVERLRFEPSVAVRDA